jgi:hypothetical protein
MNLPSHACYAASGDKAHKRGGTTAAATAAEAAAAMDDASESPAAAAAATAASIKQQPLSDGVDPQALLQTLSQTKNYTQLAAFVHSQQEVFLQTPLCVYAILHAVQLRDTLSFDKIGQGSLASEEAVLQQFELVSVLCQPA